MTDKKEPIAKEVDPLLSNDQIKILLFALLSLFVWQRISSWLKNISVRNVGIESGVPICAGAANAMLSEHQPRIEQRQSYDCLSGMVMLPANISFDYYVPGDTKVFVCNARGCRESFSIRDLDGRRDIRDRRFPRAFRLMGHPGTAKFWLKGFEPVPRPLGRPSEISVGQIRRSVKEIKSLRKKNRID